MGDNRAMYKARDENIGLVYMFQFTMLDWTRKKKCNWNQQYIYAINKYYRLDKLLENNEYYRLDKLLENNE